jgi:hypothetical protein
MIQAEHALQRAIHRYLRLAVPKPCAIWAVDHARKSSMLQAVLLKERGVLSGLHDHYVLWGGHLITLEIKVGSNTTTQGQNEFADAVIAAGGSCFVVRSIDDVENALRTAGVPLLASAQGRDEKLAVWQAKPKAKSRPRSTRDDPAAIRRMMRPGGSADRDSNLLKNRTLV